MRALSRLLSLLPDDHRERRAVVSFFGCVLLIGLISFGRFGVATDAGTMDALGRDTYNYVFKGGEWPVNPAWRYHGTSVELPLQIAQNIAAHPDDVAHGYRRVRTQHAFVFLVGFIGLIALYLIARRHFGDWRWALLCCVCYFITPRFFAHSFYNSRDIPEVTFFTVSMLTLMLLHERRTYRSAIIHGIATAFALALRMPSLIIGVLTLMIFVLGFVQNKLQNKKFDLQKSFQLLATYGTTTAIITIMLWPFLWSNPIGNFWEAYSFMSSLGQQIVFMGKTYTTMPWHYIPVWIFITVPLLYTLFFVGSAGTMIIQTLLHPKAAVKNRTNELLFLAWFFLPILSIIATGAGIYNEWRHVFFVYPAFLLIAVSGMRTVWQWAAAQNSMIPLRIVQVIIGAQLVCTSVWMIRHHPMQYAYFSLPQKTIEFTFLPGRVDYWGLSYREAWKYLLNEYPTGIISVYSPENIAFQNAYNVFPESLGRVMRVPTMGEAMFILLPERTDDLPLIHSITVDDHFLSGIYKGPVQEVLFDKATGSVQFRR